MTFYKKLENGKTNQSITIGTHYLLPDPTSIYKRLNTLDFNGGRQVNELERIKEMQDTDVC